MCGNFDHFYFERMVRGGDRFGHTVGFGPVFERSYDEELLSDARQLAFARRRGNRLLDRVGSTGRPAISTR